MNIALGFMLVMQIGHIFCNYDDTNSFGDNEMEENGVLRISDEIYDENGQNLNYSNDQLKIDVIKEETNDLFQADETFKDSLKSDVTVHPTTEKQAEILGTSTVELNTNSYTTDSSTVKKTETTEFSTTETSNFDDFGNFVDESTTASTTETVTHEIASQETKKNSQDVKKSAYVNKLSDQIRKVLEKYQESGNVIIPDVPIPDPLHIPDMDKRLSMVNMNFKNQSVYGLSSFTVQHINTDLEKMQVFVMLHMKKLIILGNYTMKSFISRAAGPFNVTLLNVTTEGAAALHYTPEGNLEASETDMDMFFNDIKLDFKNLGFMGSFFQGVVGAIGSFIFEGIKPAILTEVNTNIRKDINDKIKGMSSGVKTNASLSPVDQAVIEGRRYIRDQGYDPYHLANYTRRLGIFELNITEFSLKGLSRFYKVGEVSLSMDSGTVEFGIHLATDRLTGSCQWSVGLTKTPLRKGISHFNIEHLQIRAIIQQSLNLTQHPKLNDLDFLLGNITLKTQREDTVDLMVELVVNNLPSLLRHIIVDGLEYPIKDRAQLLLNEVDVQALVDEKLPVLDKLGV